MLSELIHQNLVGDNELARMKEVSGDIPSRLVHVQFAQIPAAVNATADTLNTFGYKQEAIKLRGWYEHPNSSLETHCPVSNDCTFVINISDNFFYFI